MKAQKRKKYLLITAFFLIFIANFPYKLGFDVTVNKIKDSELKTILTKDITIVEVTKVAM